MWKPTCTRHWCYSGILHKCLYLCRSLHIFQCKGNIFNSTQHHFINFRSNHKMRDYLMQTWVVSCSARLSFMWWYATTTSSLRPITLTAHVLTENKQGIAHRQAHDLFKHVKRDHFQEQLNSFQYIVYPHCKTKTMVIVSE